MAPARPRRAQNPERPPASLNGADWGSSDAKHLIVQDMMDGLVPYDVRIQNVRRLFDQMYANQPEFENFPFDKERYRDRITRIQKAVQRLKWASVYDKQCLAEARAIYPKQTHGPTGRILWEGSDADKFLALDMAEGKHLQMKPSQLRLTRECYLLFTPRRFSKRIDQKKEAAKPYGTNPLQAAAKREHKQRMKIKNRPQLSRTEPTAPYNNN